MREAGGVRVTQLTIYPIKSFTGQSVPQARVEPWGLAGDRRWALVDDAGRRVTAGEDRTLLRLRAEQVDARTIRIRDGDGDGIVVCAPVGVPPVRVDHARQGEAAPAGTAVDTWLSERTGRRLRLVWQEDPRVRPVSPEHGGRDGDVLSLADAGPLHLTSESSLAGLQEWVGAEPVIAMARFRPTVVIDGDAPFAEDDWPTVRLGDVQLRTAAGCDRCAVTTVDPRTLARGREPLATLARHRRWDGRTWFGTLLVPLTLGVLRVGDRVVPGA